MARVSLCFNANLPSLNRPLLSSNPATLKLLSTFEVSCYSYRRLGNTRCEKNFNGSLVGFQHFDKYRNSWKITSNKKISPFRVNAASGEGDSSSVETTDESKIDYDPSAVILPFLFPAIGGLLFGYDIGATSGAIVSIKDAVLSGTSWYDLSSVQTGLVVSGSLGGALIGSILAFLVADPLGRRRELIVASILYFFGSIIMGFSSSLFILIFGRIVYGIAIGLAMHGAPMYIAETSPSSIRGTLISLKEVFIVAGILLGYLSGFQFIGVEGGWRTIYLLSSPIAIVMAAGMFSLPFSPRWLLLKASQKLSEINKTKKASQTKLTEASKQSNLPFDSVSVSVSDSDSDSPFDMNSEEYAPVLSLQKEAIVSLKRLRGRSANEEEIESQVRSTLALQSKEMESEGEREEGWKSVWNEFASKGTWRALQIASGLVLFQQITGQPSVLYYAVDILKDAGFASSSDASLVSVFIGFFKLILTGVAVLTVDKWGRRPLLLLGIFGLTSSLVLLSSFYLLHLPLPILSVFALLLYVGSYQVSFGPISWLVVSEIFPLKVRGRAQSISTLVNFSSNAFVTFAFPPIQASLGQGGTFLAFAIIGVFAFAFVFFQVPETKGLSLEQIEAHLILEK